MKRIFVPILISCACYLFVPMAQAQRPVPPHHKKPVPQSQQAASPQNFAASAQTQSRVALPSLSASAGINVLPVSCPPEATGAVCGYVKVPLDREFPWRGSISIYFEQHLHSGPGPAESAILFNEGGPGAGTTVWRDDAFYLFSQNLDKHDLLLIDDRGRGFSTTIDCDELQYGTAPFAQAVADCATQLGDSASLYSTGDIAEDTEAVRAALGYEKVDYFGWSYGGADVVAYASRFGEHLRSIVLDAPYAGRVIDQFGLYDHYRGVAGSRLVSLDCLRSPACSVDHPSPAAELNALISSLRLHPVQGDAYDAYGNLIHLQIDETFLLTYLLSNPTGNFVNTGELLAAAEALAKGDSKPLLRLGAESFYPLEYAYASGDPTYYSAGARQATFCVDPHLPWDWDAPIDRRQAQFDHAVAALPSNYFDPFSKKATASLVNNLSRQCLWWEKPTPSTPVVPHHANYPAVPTLVFSGDLDMGVPIEVTRDVAGLFPNSSQVSVAEVGHGSVWWSPCAANLASRFIETLRLGDTRCTRTPRTVWPAVGRFPRNARDARPAEIDSSGNNQIGAAERKIVTVAVAAATDAMQRSIIGSGDGYGLRNGTFHTDYADVWTTTLTDVAFTEDVIVSGTASWYPGFTPYTWGFAGDFALNADLFVSGPGFSNGLLHVEGTWQAPGRVGTFKVTGTLGGRNVAVLVPEA